MCGVRHVLLATDSDALAEDVCAALAEPETVVSRVRVGTDVREAVDKLEPELVLLDMQIGNMGGIATSIDLRHEARAERLPEVKILMLLDREVDTWIAGEAQADAELVKPADAFRLRKVAMGLLEAVAAD